MRYLHCTMIFLIRNSHFDLYYLYSSTRLIDDNNDFYECIAINNFASIRAAEKIGFKKDGFVKKSKYLHTLSRVKESSTLLYKYNRNTNSSGMKKVNKS